MSATLRKHRLSPLPVEGFADLKLASFESDRWSRRVEKYPWGCVLFVSNKEAGEHATIVAIGDVNLSTGTVLDGKAIEDSDEVAAIDALVPWYVDLAIEADDADAPPARGEGEDVPIEVDGDEEIIEEEDVILDDDDEPVAPVAIPGPGAPGARAVAPPKLKAKPKPSYPPCVGYHTEEPVCDGEFSVQRGLVEAPCSWRDRCMALQDFCRTQGKAIEEVVAPGAAHEAVVAATSRFLEEFGPYEAPPAVKRAAGRRAEEHAPPGLVEPPGPAGAPVAPLKPVKGKPGGMRERKATPVPDAGAPPPPKAAKAPKAPKPPKAKRRGPVPPPRPPEAITHAEAREFALRFWNDALAALGWIGAPNADAPGAGECYLVDAAKAGFLTGYRVLGDADVAFIRLWLKPGLGGIHVQLVVDPEHPALQEVAAHLKPWKHGTFRVVIKAVGNAVEPGVAVAVIKAIGSDLCGAGGHA